MLSGIKLSASSSGKKKGRVNCKAVAQSYGAPYTSGFLGLEEFLYNGEKETDSFFTWLRNIRFCDCRTSWAGGWDGYPSRWVPLPGQRGGEQVHWCFPKLRASNAPALAFVWVNFQCGLEPDENLYWCFCVVQDLHQSFPKACMCVGRHPFLLRWSLSWGICGQILFGKTNSVRLFDSGSACVLQSSQMAPSIAAWKGRELTTESASTVLFFSLSSNGS